MKCENADFFWNKVLKNDATGCAETPMCKARRIRKWKED
jgi:hypothetical protein